MEISEADAFSPGAATPTTDVREPAIIRSAERLVLTGTLIGGVVVLIMAAQIVVDVVARNVYNHPLPGTLEMVSIWWMPCVAYLAMGYAQVKDEQIRVTLLFEKAKPSDVRMMNIVAEVLTGALIAWMFVLGLDRLTKSIQMTESALLADWILYWPGRLVCVLGLVLVFVAVGVRIYRLVHSAGVVVDEFGASRELEK